MSGKRGNQTVATRYALAFFNLAKEQGEIETVLEDMNVVKNIIKESSDFLNLMNNATLLRADQARAISAIADKAGFCDLTKKFLGTLALKRRLSILLEIIASVEKEISEHKGELTAYITVVKKLSSGQVKDIEKSLSGATGKIVKIEQNLKADIIGGMVIQIGSQLIDNSVKSKLDRLHRNLKSSNRLLDKTNMREVA